MRITLAVINVLRQADVAIVRRGDDKVAACAHWMSLKVRPVVGGV